MHKFCACWITNVSDYSDIWHKETLQGQMSLKYKNESNTINVLVHIIQGTVGVGGITTHY